MKSVGIVRTVSASLLAGAAVVMSAQSGHAATASLATCPLNYFCVDSSPATPQPDVLIPAGESRTIPGGLNAYELTNNTRFPYCVQARPNLSLAPAQSRAFEPPLSVFAVTTRGSGTVCPS
ncbi:hypothetical protein [Nonomuraea sp. NPDC050783]|uniref:hypothetical protein n=1 Tax=Nonomuraea sp. NPDC050783 TaxID=3154634 RepID=UPI003466A4AB